MSLGRDLARAIAQTIDAWFTLSVFALIISLLGRS